MPLDPSIIMSGQPADITGSISNAFNLRNLAQQTQMNNIKAQQSQQEFNDQQAMKNAYANNTKIGPDGSASLNRTGMLSDLAKTSPHLIPQVQQQLVQTDYNTKKMQMENSREQLGFIAQALGGVSDQKSYEKVIGDLKSKGFDISDFTPQYDPNIVKSHQYQALTFKDQLETSAKQQGLDIEKQKASNEGKKLDVELFKTFGGNAPGRGGGAGASTDPATLVPRLVPPESRKQVFEEIKNAQNVGTNGPKIMDAFERASKENTVLRTGGGWVRTPGSVMQLHQMMLPNFKSIDGTVRQAAMDESFHNVTPMPGDSDEKIAEKRAALQGWLSSESAAPTAKGFGIDLSKYPSTSYQSAMAQNRGSNSNTKSANTDIHPALKDMSISQLQALKAQKLKEQSIGKK